MKIVSTFCLLLALAAPASADGHKMILAGESPASIDLATFLKDHPAQPEEGIKATQLIASQYSSQHIVQILNHEHPHIHKDHDLTFFVLQGQGTLILGKESIPVKEGDVIFIPRGTPHHYLNKGRGRTIGYVVYSPPFDGKDTIPVP